MTTTNKGGSTYLNGGRGIVKEGVKVRRVLGSFGCDLYMQDTVVDGKAHKNNPYGWVPVKVKAPGKIEIRYQGRNQLW